MLDSSLVGARSCLSTNISFSEQIDVVVVLALDQAGQISMIEAFAFASLVANDSIVVQVDLDIIQVLVFESVELF